MITVYSKNNCPQCKMVKKYLNEHGVEFQEHNIDEEPQYIDYVLGLGYKAVPVVVTDETSFSGFQPDLLKAFIA